MNATATESKRDRFLWEVFVTALEGGIGYWARVEKYHWGAGMDDDLAGFYAIVTDAEGEDDSYFSGEKRIDADTIRKGLKAFRDGDPLPRNKCLTDIIRNADKRSDTCPEGTGDIDSDAADVIVQVGLFGEVVFG